MCSTPKTPSTDTIAPEPEPIAAPTQADAKVQKAAISTRNQQAAKANPNIKTTELGVTDEAVTKKKTLLGE